jgi:flagellar motor component MotA
MKYFDKATIITIVITALLFIVALFSKGITNAILLEAGVLLVSVKLIMAAYKNHVNFVELKKELEEIKELLRKNSETKS